MYAFFRSFLGLELSSMELTFWHLTIRMLIIYILGIVTLRLQRQFMTIRTPFTYMLNIIIGSVFANAIIGTVPYLPVLGMAIVMNAITWFIALITFYFPGFEKIIKGKPEILIKDGQIQWQVMRKNLITKDELMDSVHRLTKTNDLSHIKIAYFENSGRITFVIK